MTAKRELEKLGWKFPVNKLGWYVAVPPGGEEKHGQACRDEDDALKYASEVTTKHGLDTVAGEVLLGAFYLEWCKQHRA